MTTRLDLYSLQVFLAVLEEGSIAAAAVREHIAPSALSKRLSELERTLDVTLFQRHARGVEPTSAAKALARRTEPRCFLARRRCSLANLTSCCRKTAGALIFSPVESVAK